MDPVSPAPERPAYPPRLAWALVRLVGAGLIAAAIVAQLSTTLGIAVARDQHLPTVLWNFFSFFTILSNVLAVLTLALGGLWLLIRGGRSLFEPRWMTVLFLCVGTYMVTTGIVYNVLLRGIALPQGATVPWSNEVLHVVGPLLLLADLVLRIARRAASWRVLAAVVVFPILWAGYTLARGEHITNPTTGQPWWYPYPFLNPYLTPNGYLGVGAYVIGISAVIVGVAAIAVWWTRRRRRDSATRTETGIVTAEPVEVSG